MRLTVVGCSGSFPGPDSAASCYLVEAPYEGRTYRLLLDLGSGALGPLQSHAELESIDAVLLSHLHADHCLDLCGFYVVRKYRPQGALPPIPVYGPEGTAERMARAYDITENPGMTEEFEFRSFGVRPFGLGPFEVAVARVDHPVEAYGVRLSHGGAALVYSGDTGACAALEELAAGCEVFLAEASFLDSEDNPPGLHMTGADAARIAARAGVGQLVLTHVPPWYDRQQVLAEATPHFTGEVSLALTGATYKL